MKNYRYFENTEENAYFTETPCQFCGSSQFCLDGVFFDRPDITSICLYCFDKKQVNVEVPEYIKARVKTDADRKFESLQFTPPVPWIQSNDWPVCCDDYMVYIGEWEQEDFNSYSKRESGKDALAKLLAPEILKRVENLDVLWEDLGYGTAAFAFRCPQCGKTVIICQDY